MNVWPYFKNCKTTIEVRWKCEVYNDNDMMKTDMFRRTQCFVLKC